MKDGSPWSDFQLTIESKDAKKQKISKSLPTLLREVSQGHYEEFREWLKQNKITNLNLIKKAQGINLSHLVQALQDTAVTTLNLHNNKLGVEDAKALGLALASNVSLTTLYLGANEIGAEGAMALASMLKTNTSIRCLDLGHNEIGNEGAEALGSALTSNKSLMQLSIECNRIETNSILKLASALLINNSLTLLNLSFNILGEKGACDFACILEENKSLKILELNGCGIGNGAKSLLSNKSLTHLSLNNNQIEIGPDEGQSLDLLSLTHLDLGKNPIGAKGVEKLCFILANSFSLTHLNLERTQINDVDVTNLSAALAKNVSLITLNLGYNNISEKGLKSLGLALTNHPSLTTFNLQSNQIDDKGIEALSLALAGNKSLTTLTLYNNRFGTEGAKTLAILIKNSFLLKVGVCIVYKELLKDALKQNHQKIVLIPYYATCLRYLSENEKLKHQDDQPKLSSSSSSEEQLRYAGGILMRVAPEICESILSFLPLMRVKVPSITQGGHPVSRIRNYSDRSAGDRAEGTGLFKKTVKGMNTATEKIREKPCC